MTWTIDKQFSFCYSHRVWVQELIGDYCERGDVRTKCKAKHGHEALVHVFLECEDLNKQNMCTDFKHLGFLRDFFDDYIDHRFIVDVNDPGFSMIVPGMINNSVGCIDTIIPRGLHLPLQDIYIPQTSLLAGKVIDVSSLEESYVKDIYGGFFLVDFVPTSERLSEWVLHLVDAKMKLIGVKTSRVDWFETPKSRSTYYSAH